MTGEEPGVKTYVVDPAMAPFAIRARPRGHAHHPTRPVALHRHEVDRPRPAEAMWGPRAHPVTDTLATQAIRTLRNARPGTAAAPEDLDARLEAQLAGWMSMAGVVNVRVHPSHTLGHQIGARWDVPHGITSGITLPPVMRYLRDEHPAGVERVAAAFDGTSVDRGAEASGRSSPISGSPPACATSAWTGPTSRLSPPRPSPPVAPRAT